MGRHRRVSGFPLWVILTLFLGPAPAVPAWATESGLTGAISFSATKEGSQAVPPGIPVYVEVKITNNSDKPLALIEEELYWPFAMVVRDSSGKILGSNYPSHALSREAPRKIFAPGEVFSYCVDILKSTSPVTPPSVGMLSLHAPGTYTVQFVVDPHCRYGQLVGREQGMLADGIKSNILDLTIRQLGPEEVKDYLSGIRALSKEDRIVRANVAGYAGSTAAVQYLVSLASEDTSPVVRNVALYALVRIGDKSPAARIEDILLTDEDPNVKAVSADVLGQWALGRSVPALISVLGQRDRVGIESGAGWVWYAPAIRALGQIGDPRAIPVLTEISETDTTDWVKMAAEKALQGIRTSQENTKPRNTSSVQDIPVRNTMSTSTIDRERAYDERSASTSHGSTIWVFAASVALALLLCAACFAKTAKLRRLVLAIAAVFVVIAAVCLVVVSRWHDPPLSIDSLPDVVPNPSPEPAKQPEKPIAENPDTPFDPNRRSHSPGFSRPEDRAGDFSGLDTTTLLDKLNKSDDVGVRRKAAQELGDRSIAGNLELSAGDRETLDSLVDKQMQSVASTSSQDRAEANMQIQRLWRLSADRLIESLNNSNEAVAEAAIKNLVLMRNAEIVQKIIDKAKSSTNQEIRCRAVFALGMMAEKSYTVVDGRPLMDEETSSRLVRDRVVPFLQDIQKTDLDPRIQRIVANAFHFLANPVDRRPRKVSGGP